MDLKTFQSKISRRYALNTDQICDLHEYTENFDYDCRFKDGICKNELWVSNTSNPNPMCCCKDCYSNMGYLSHHNPIMVVRYLKLFARLFKEDVGFWRSGKGCVLPRKVRSPICLAYRCLGKNGSLNITAIQEVEMRFTNALKLRKYSEAGDLKAIHSRLLNENKNKNKV